MVGMKRILFFLMVLAIFSFSVNAAAAADFSVNVTQPQNVYAGNTTNFSVIITNSGADDWFSLAAIGTYTSWISAESQNVFVASGSSVSATFWATPVADALPTNYEYSIIVSKAGTGERIEKSVFVPVLQSTSVIMKDFSLSCSECRPGETVTVSVTLRNIGSKPISNMKLVFSLGDRTKIIPVTSLDFGMLKSFSTDFIIDNMAAPGKYSIEAKLMQDTVLAQKSAQFTVPSLPNIKTVKNVSSSIFGNYAVLVSTNLGNAAQTAEIKSKVLNAWYSFYSGAKPSSAGGEYGWSVSIAPGESVTISYSEVFWPVPLALVILVFIAAYYYVIISSLSIRKRIVRKHGKEFSVSIHVKSGLSPIDTAVVRDVVPKEFEVSGTFESIKPVVRKSQTGTELVWRLGRLKSREERILHYRINPVSAFTTARLHPAELSGKRGDKTVSRMSDFVAVHGEPKEAQAKIKVVFGK